MRKTKRPHYVERKFDSVVRSLQLEGEFPSDADLDWMQRAVQRHTGGFDVWWRQNRDRLSGRDWMNIFITVWEAGRGAKVPNRRLTK